MGHPAHSLACCCEDAEEVECPWCAYASSPATVTVAGVTVASCVSFGSQYLSITSGDPLNGTFNYPYDGVAGTGSSAICGWADDRLATPAGTFEMTAYSDSGCTTIGFWEPGEGDDDEDGVATKSLDAAQLIRTETGWELTIYAAPFGEAGLILLFYGTLVADEDECCDTLVFTNEYTSGDVGHYPAPAGEAIVMAYGGTATVTFDCP